MSKDICNMFLVHLQLAYERGCQCTPLTWSHAACATKPYNDLPPDSTSSVLVVMASVQVAAAFGLCIM